MSSIEVKVNRHSLSPQEIEARLREAGINPTAQRIAICKYVLCEALHPTAEQIKSWVDQNFPKMSLATIYNTLNALVSAKLLKELRFPHSDCLLYDSNMETHFHFLDEETGEIMDLNPHDVEVSVNLAEKFKVNDVEVLIRGTLA